MRSEEPIEIDGGILRSTGCGNCQRRPCGVVGAFTEWNDHVQPVDGAALKDRDQHAAPGVGGGDEFGRERREQIPDSRARARRS